MQNDNVKFKIIFLSFLILFFSGCAGNVDLRQQTRENKTKEDFTSFENSIILEKKENNQPLKNNLAEKEPVRILFVGDMMFDRHIREAVGKYGGKDYNYVLEPVRDKLSEYDLVVGNLEGPITDEKSVSANTEVGEKGHMTFTFDPAVAGALAENNVQLVNLGNNHILNQGKKGAEQTKKYLDEAGVEYFGDSVDLETEFPSGNSVSFVSYNYSVPNSVDKTIENIIAARKKSDIVIVCPHWGTEYKTGDPGKAVRALARRFVDAGADAVIGTHPHVVQMMEVYNGRKIYYSLGNFVFDQYFQKETMEGLGVEMTINPDNTMEYSELKFEMTKRGQTKIMQN